MGRQVAGRRQRLWCVALLVAATTLSPIGVASAARAAEDSPGRETSLAYVDQTNEHYGQIVVLDSATGQRRWVTPGPADGQSPRWSPHGDRILYLDMSEELRADLVVMESDGSRARRLVSGKDYEIHDAAWGPGGGRVLLSMTTWGDQAATPRLYLMSTGTGALAPVRVTVPNRRIRGIDWSRDGTIAVEAVDDRGAGGSALFVGRPDGSALRQVTRPRAGLFDTTPRWSPDGGRLLFSRVEEGAGCEQKVMVLTASTGELRRAPTGCSGYLASWWPDGTHVLYNDHVDSLFSVALEGPDELLVQRKALMASTPALPRTGA